MKDEDTKGGTCSKCGMWKGGTYGMNGNGVQGRHVCPNPSKYVEGALARIVAAINFPLEAGPTLVKEIEAALKEGAASEKKSIEEMVKDTLVDVRMAKTEDMAYLDHAEERLEKYLSRTTDL